jgi:hypothetical protein
MSSLAMGMFLDNHTLRLEASKLRDLESSSSANALPFDLAQLKRLTIFFHGGSLSSCDSATFKLLGTSIPNLTGHFPNLEVLKIDISWDINEEQEWFGGHYIHFYGHGELGADHLPLVDIPGAQRTCREFLTLAWQLHEFCVQNSCEVEVFSVDRSAVFTGKWEHDLEVATFLLPNSNAWNPRGFQTWMEEYTETHYALGDALGEGEPIAVEYVGRAADLGPADSDGYFALPLQKCLAWVKKYPAIAESQKAAVAREKEEREASY